MLSKDVDELSGHLGHGHQHGRLLHLQKKNRKATMLGVVTGAFDLAAAQVLHLLLTHGKSHATEYRCIPTNYEHNFTGTAPMHQATMCAKES